MSKQRILMQKLITEYHPDFKNSQDLRNIGLAKPELFNVERLVEEALAYNGSYEFVDQDGYDFSDFSDSKTSTVAEYDRVMAIGSVESKIGALRITIYNPFKQDLDYMYMPREYVQMYKEANYGKSEHKERLRVTWNAKQDHYNSFEQFRCNNFLELAQAQG